MRRPGCCGYLIRPGCKQADDIAATVEVAGCKPKNQPEFQPCPLVGLKYLVSADDIAATVEVEQIFSNTSHENAIEVKYQHPIDPNCVITSCEIIIDKRVIKCLIKEKDEARDDYEDAIASSQSAILAETGNTTDILVFNIGIVPPSTSVIIRLKYLLAVSLTPGTELKKGQITIPQSLIPTYEPKETLFPEGDDPLSRKSKPSTVVPEITIAPSEELLFEVGDVNSLKDIIINISRKDKQNFNTDTIKVSASVGVGSVGKFVTEEFSLAIPVSGEYVGTDGEIPNLLFLVDCSGSMRGTRIQQAERCMKYFVQSIPEGTKFNIVRFGSTFKSLFSKSRKQNSATFDFQPLSSKSLASARKFITNLSADLKGTNLNDPLEAARNSIVNPTQIIILTDGAVKNTDATLKTVFSLSRMSRISAIGLGDGCSRDLIEGLARFSSGSAYFVQTSEIASQVAAVSQDALQPVLGGLSLGLLRDIEGFKPCFPTFKNEGISMLPSQTRTLLFGFAPEHFDVSQLAGNSVHLKGGVNITCFPETTTYLIGEQSVKTLSKELIETKTGEPLSHREASSLVRHALSRGMSASSLTDLFPEPIVITSINGIPKKAPLSIKATLTPSGKLVLGNKPNREITRSDISFSCKKLGECLSLRQSDGTVKTILLTSADKQKLLHLLDYMPQENGNLTHVQHGDEIHKNYNFELVKDCRLHQLAAAKRIREIEDMLRIGEWSQEISQEAVRLSLSHNVLSKFTSFVAVDEDGSCNAVKSIRKIDVNVKHPSKSSLATVRSSRISEAPRMSRRDAKGCFKSKKGKSKPLRVESFSMEAELAECEDDDLDIAPAASRQVSTAIEMVPDDIIFLQSADGSWMPSAELFSLLSISKDHSSDVFTVTALVINYLEKHFAHVKSEWFLVTSKAVLFLEKNNMKHLLDN